NGNLLSGRGPNAPAGVMWWSPQSDPGSTFPLASDADSKGRGAFVAVVIFTLILLLSPQNWFPALAPFRIAFLAAGTAAAFLLWDRWKRRQPLLNLTRQALVAAALLAWALLTLPLSYWPGGSVTVLSDLY